jgi:hypothetical protein
LSAVSAFRWNIPFNGDTTAPVNEDPQSDADPAPLPRATWAWPTMWMVLGVAVISGGIYIFKSCRDLPGQAIIATSQAITNVSRALADVASAFGQQNITTSFTSYATTLNRQSYLQFATLKQTEVFTQSDQSFTGFGYIPLPEVIVEARAPIDYTYYLDLNGKWDFFLKDKTIYVHAPRIRFNKPAVDASEIEYEVRKGSILRNHSEAQETLKKSITFLAQVKARENISLVRETGRRQVEEFVEKWLSKSFRDAQDFAIRVYFEDESPPVPFDAPLKPAE